MLLVKWEKYKKMTLLESMKMLDYCDFRICGKTKFLASEIAIITICSIIAGGSGYRDMERFGNEKNEWLRSFLQLKNGIPSHDTFRYFWKNLAPARFNTCFMQWLDSVSELADGDTVHIDGKCLRRAFSEVGKQPCIVSAYSSREKLVIGQVKTDEKSNEITAIPNLLNQLYLMGAIVTIDAAGCQKKIVKKIVKKHGDYFISLKGNQETFHEEVKGLFDATFKNRNEYFKSYSQTEKGHGRIVTRKCTQTGYIDWFADKDKWSNLRSLCMIESETINIKDGTTAKDRRFFISSLKVDPKRALKIATEHWDIENPLHWTLDMVFDEDHSRIRTGYAVENLAIMRHFAFDVIRLASSASGGITNRKKTLTWNDEKLRKAIEAA